MNINTLDRSDLKQYFVANAIPTQSNFAELIDAGLNQRDDGIAKLPGDPLSIEATGDATSQRKVLNLYENFTDQSATWVLSLNPRGDPADEATARAGFSISDGAGNSRLFIDKASGNVGIGTTIPLQTLDVNGRINVKDGVIQRGGIAITGTSDLGLYSGIPGWIRIVSTNSPIRFFTDGGIGTNAALSIVQGKVGIGTITPLQPLDVSGKVGIGTTGPLQPLDVRGNAYVSGKVGIGTTTPLQPLDVKGNASVSGNLTVDGMSSLTVENWRAATLQNGWANFLLSFSACAYFKDSMGIVHLRGVVKNGTIGEFPIFTLPVGFRPVAREMHVVNTYLDVSGRVDIMPDGRVFPQKGNSTYLSLDGITFRAA